MVSRACAGADAIAEAAIAAAKNHLHVRVIGASAAFGGDPVNVLGRILDVTSLAVDAILGVDLEPRLSILTIDKFVHARRTITLLGSGINRQVDRRGYIGVLERQMNRLV